MRKLITVILLLIVAIGAAGIAAYEYYWLGSPETFAAPRDITIEKGESFRAVTHKLAAAGVIRSALAMQLYGQFSGDARRIKPGDYEFKGGEPITEVMHHLIAGDFMVVTVVIPEGLTIHQIAERLEAAGLACQGDFDEAARSGVLVRALGLMPLGAEGYLFPATYRFSPHATSNEALFAMLSRFFRVLTPEIEARMFELGLNTRQIVTMASIVEKEARVPGERPLIAGVFYNRLRVGMPLQSDPTAEYSLDGLVGTAAQAVRTRSAFNTYEIAGLPPGPIANPGLNSIQAALYPAHTDFLYFVARDDGTHVFSKSFNEHKRAIVAVSKAHAASHSRPIAANHAD